MKTITKVALSTMTLVAVAAGSVAGTLAYLKAETPTAVNAQTVGNVKIEQIEQQRVDDTDNQHELEAYVPFAALNPCYYEGSSIPWAPKDEWVVPGDEAWKVVEDTEGVVDKFVTVKNTGENAAYVRTVIAFEVGKDGVNGSYCHFSCNSTDNIKNGPTWDFKWIDGEAVTIGDSDYALGVFTYTEALESGETTIPSIRQIYMDKTATNEVMEAYGDTFNILVMSQAVQAQMDGLPPEEALNEAFYAIDADNHPWSETTTVADEAALTAAKGSVMVSKDIKLTEAVTKLNNETTIILDSGSITANRNDTSGASKYSALTVTGDVTIDGTGTVENEGGYAISLGDVEADLVINGGTYIGKCTAINVVRGTLTINGGFFEDSDRSDANSYKNGHYLVNCIDKNYVSGDANVIIMGGTFVNWNPADNASEGAGTNFVPEGYAVQAETQANGDVWYTVVAE